MKTLHKCPWCGEMRTDGRIVTLWSDHWICDDCVRKMERCTEEEKRVGEILDGLISQMKQMSEVF